MMMSLDNFRATYLSPDIAFLIATFQNGDYRDVLAIQRLVIPPHLARDTFPHHEYAALAATVDPWLSEYGLARLPRLFDCLDDMHATMLLYAAYSGRVDVVQRALAIHAVTPAMMMLLVDVAAWNNQRPVLDYLVSLPHEDGWMCSSFALIAASKGGHVDIVRFLHERFPLVPTTEDAMDMAAAGGHLDVVRYLHAHRPEGCTTRAMDDAAKNGHLDVLQFLHSNRSEGCTQNAMDWACEHGHLEVAQWLHEHRRWEGLTENAFDGAAANNHLSVVEFLHRVVRAPSTIKATERAADGGHWTMVQWIHNHRPVQGWTDVALKTAAARAYFEGRTEVMLPKKSTTVAGNDFKRVVESGDVQALELLVRHRPDECSLDEAMSAATKGGQVDVVRWLLDRGVRPPSIVELVNHACTTGHLGVVELLYPKSPDSTPKSLARFFQDLGDLPPPRLCDALDTAATNGHLQVVQWLHARGFPASDTSMFCAVSNGHLDVVRWLQKHREEDRPSVMIEEAARKGHFSVVRWVMRHRRLRATSFPMWYAAQKGDLATLEFLYDNRSEPVEANVLDTAAKCGHLGILLFLHTRETQGCTQRAIFDAVAYGRFHVAKWLHATYGFEVTRNLVLAAIRSGDLVCLRWLLTHWQGDILDVNYREMYPSLTMLHFFLEKGGVCSEGTMDHVAGKGHVALLIKMHEFGATCSANAMQRAVTKGHVDVVWWLFANRTEGCAEQVVIRGQSCWSSVMAFMVNDFVPVTPVAMIGAAERGDMAVVEWLHSRSKLEKTRVVAWATNHPELDTAQWILKKTKSRKRKQVIA